MTQTEKRLRRNAQIAEYLNSGEIIVEDTRNVVVAIAAYKFEYETVYDVDKCEEMKTKVIEVLSTEAHPWGGYRTAGGHWYLEKDYDPSPFGVAYRDQMGPAYY